MIKSRRRKNQTKKLDGTHFLLYTIDKKPADTASPEGRWEKGVTHESPPVHLLELAQKSGYWFLYLLYAVPVPPATVFQFLKVYVAVLLELLLPL